MLYVRGRGLLRTMNTNKISRRDKRDFLHFLPFFRFVETFFFPAKNFPYSKLCNSKGTYVLDENTNKFLHQGCLYFSR